MKLTRGAGAITALSLVSVLAACGGASDSESSEGLDEVVFALANERSIQYHPYYVAEDAGFFEEEGLDVELQVLSGSGLAIQQLVAGQVDIANVGGGAALQAVDTGQDLVWDYTYFYRNIFTIVTPADSGIDSLDDLEGGVIGITDPSGGEVPFVRSVFGSIGLADGTDYEMLPVGEGGQVTYDALDKGTVDAYVSSVYDVASIEAIGMDLNAILPDEFVYVPSIGHVTTRDHFEDQGDVLTRFNRAIAKATVYSQANPEEAMAIAREHGPELFEDEALADAMWATTVDMLTPPDDAGTDLIGAPYMPGWDAYLDFASRGTAAEGALQTDIAPEQVADDSLIAAVNDFDHEAAAAGPAR